MIKNDPFDHVLLIGYGSPSRPEEVAPFLKERAKGISISDAALAEMFSHYETIGGGSPYTGHCFYFFHRLQDELLKRGIAIPMFLAMRFWDPFLRDVMNEIKQRGLKRGLGIILAPHRSRASFEDYLKQVEEAKKATGSTAIQYEYIDPWHDHPLFIAAHVDLIRNVMEAFPPCDYEKIPWVFCAHSLPCEMAKKSDYVRDLQKTAGLIAKELNHFNWQLAYQSRSGPPKQPWLEPDVHSVIWELKNRGFQTVVLDSVGFLCDNVEILFDLDVETQEQAKLLDIRYFRIPTVMPHPKFLEMMTRLVTAKIKPGITE